MGNDVELKVTLGRVREAAKQCSSAQEALKVLFPEAFAEPIGALPPPEQRSAGKITGRVRLGGDIEVLAWTNEVVPGAIRLSGAVQWELADDPGRTYGQILRIKEVPR